MATHSIGVHDAVRTRLWCPDGPVRRHVLSAWAAPPASSPSHHQPRPRASRSSAAAAATSPTASSMTDSDESANARQARQDKISQAMGRMFLADRIARMEHETAQRAHGPPHPHPPPPPHPPPHPHSHFHGWPGPWPPRGGRPFGAGRGARGGWHHGWRGGARGSTRGWPARGGGFPGRSGFAAGQGFDGPGFCSGPARGDTWSGWDSERWSKEPDPPPPAPAHSSPPKLARVHAPALAPSDNARRPLPRHSSSIPISPRDAVAPLQPQLFSGSHTMSSSPPEQTSSSRASPAPARPDAANTSQSSASTPKSHVSGVRVIDASVLVYSLRSVHDLVKAKRWRIVVPLDALHTLDRLKSARDPLVSHAVRRAMRFVDTYLVPGCGNKPALVAQRPTEEATWDTVLNRWGKARSPSQDLDDTSSQSSSFSSSSLSLSSSSKSDFSSWGGSSVADQALDPEQTPPWVKAVLRCAAHYHQNEVSVLVAYPPPRGESKPINEQELEPIDGHLLLHAAQQIGLATELAPTSQTWLAVARGDPPPSGSQHRHHPHHLRHSHHSHHSHHSPPSHHHHYEHRNHHHHVHHGHGHDHHHLSDSLQHQHKAHHHYSWHDSHESRYRDHHHHHPLHLRLHEHGSSFQEQEGQHKDRTDPAEEAGAPVIPPLGPRIVPLSGGPMGGIPHNPFPTPGESIERQPKVVKRASEPPFQPDQHSFPSLPSNVASPSDTPKGELRSGVLQAAMPARRR